MLGDLLNGLNTLRLGGQSARHGKPRYQVHEIIGWAAVYTGFWWDGVRLRWDAGPREPKTNAGILRFAQNDTSFGGFAGDDTAFGRVRWDDTAFGGCSGNETSLRSGTENP